MLIFTRALFLGTRVYIRQSHSYDNSNEGDRDRDKVLLTRIPLKPFSRLVEIYLYTFFSYIFKRLKLQITQIPKSRN